MLLYTQTQGKIVDSSSRHFHSIPQNINERYGSASVTKTFHRYRVELTFNIGHFGNSSSSRIDGCLFTALNI
jgi:hypothetical protein